MLHISPKILLLVAQYFLMGWATSHLATRKGRNPRYWFFIGMFFGFVSMIVLYFLPTKSKDSIGANPQSHPQNNLNGYSAKSEPSEPETINVTAKVTSHTKEWFYLDDQQKNQKVEHFDALKEMWKKGELTNESYVWCTGMDNWVKIIDDKKIKTDLET